MGKEAEDGHYIHFKPDSSFRIETGAPYLARLMTLRGVPLVLELGTAALRLEPGCRAEEIVRRYRLAYDSQALRLRTPYGSP
jgi:hypothetical protein